MTLLAGDIGGTKTLLQIASFNDGVCRVLKERRYTNDVFASFEEILADFLRADDHGRLSPAAACLGVAGPIVEAHGGQRVKITNLPWAIDSAVLAQRFAIPSVVLINDFQAAGYGMNALGPADVVTIQKGDARPHGPRALIGAGTGLGQAILLWSDGHYEPHPTEGGHCDFAPVDDKQIELLRWLSKRFGHVSYERVLSGPGLVNIYEFLRHAAGAHAPAFAADTDDAPALVARAALSGQDSHARQALDMFVKIYGAQAGNFALTVFATGGVYLAGGVTAHIAGEINSAAFTQAFIDKGRLSALASTFPVHIIVNAKVGLLGAAQVAHRLAERREPAPPPVLREERR